MNPDYLPVQDIRIGDSIVLGTQSVTVEEIICNDQRIAFVYTLDLSTGPGRRYWQARVDDTILVVGRAATVTSPIPGP